MDKFWKGHDGQMKKNTCKNAYLGSIFIPEKCVFRVCFESPFMRVISSLKYKCLWLDLHPCASIDQGSCPETTNKGTDFNQLICICAHRQSEFEVL